MCACGGGGLINCARFPISSLLFGLVMVRHFCAPPVVDLLAFELKWVGGVSIKKHLHASSLL